MRYLPIGNVWRWAPNGAAIAAEARSYRSRRRGVKPGETTRDMTSETTTTLPATAVLSAAKRFFTGSEAIHAAWIEAESDTHVSFATFRSNVLVSALPDPEREGMTRVRASTLRDEAAVGKFLTYLRRAS